MSLHIVLNTDPTSVTQVWSIIPAVGSFIGGLCVALFTYLLYRRKMNAEIHKSQTDTVILTADKIVELLSKIESAHRKSLIDETTIAHLKKELDECIDGHKSCRELRESLLSFLYKVEMIIADMKDCQSLLSELQGLEDELKV